MNDGIVKQVQDALAPIADKLQQGAEFMYRVFYKQTIIEAIVEILACLFVIALVLIIARVVRNKLTPDMFDPTMYSWEEKNGGRKAKQEKHAKIAKLMVTLASIVISGLVSIGIFDGIMKLGNPHYYTITRIIDSVKSKEIK